MINEIRDKHDKAILGVLAEMRPETGIHLAAQQLARLPYQEPGLAYETNIMGTVDVCECVRKDSYHLGGNPEAY